MKPHHMVLTGIGLLAAGFASALFMPFVKHPPERDSGGYYFVSPRSKEKRYSTEARSIYWSFYGQLYFGGFTLVTGVGVLALGGYRSFKIKNEH